MSRAEKKPIIAPSGVTIHLGGGLVSVTGPRGVLEQSFPLEFVQFHLDGSQLSLKAANNSRQARAIVGTARAIVDNMITGVTRGFTRQLEISGVGFKAILEKGTTLNLSLGTSHPIRYVLPAGIRVVVVDGVKLTVEGIDRQKVGQVAADIYAFYPIEPYKGKGVAIVGKFVRRKEGKKAA
ncbi:MAG: 50S ribosomal protein L6 [Puniceicoccales bacterium]|jgi:large subunit ribosomal protein L6|nr:50S ribosomal protein L6 [Puniceicoccales bacterium]